MAVKQNPTEGEVAPHEGESKSESESGGRGGAADRERKFRDFIGFFGSLVGLFAFGLGILPASTAAERFLVVVAAFALSCAISLVVRLVPWSRTTAWLAVSGVVGVVSLAGLSVLVQQDGNSAVAAEGQSTSTSRAGASDGARAASPSLAGVLPSQRSGYTPLYTDDEFALSDESCQNGTVNFASYVDFYPQSPKVTVVGDRSSRGGGNVEIACNGTQAILQFEDPAAPVSGNPSAEQCAAAIDTHPISRRIPLNQLRPGDEFCLMTGSAGALGPLVLGTVKAVSGSLTFTTTWTATAWSLPSTS